MPVAGLVVALPLAGWLLAGAGGTAGPGKSAPKDLEAQVPGRNFVLAHATPDHMLERRARNRREEATLTVGRGDTLMALLQDAGVTRGEAFEAVRQLKAVYSPRDLRPGQDIHLALLHDDTAVTGTDQPRLAGLSLRASPEEDVKVTRTGDGEFEAAAVARTLSPGMHRARGRIESSLFAAGDAADVPAQVMLQVIHQYSYAVDFQRDPRKGDRFEIVHRTFTEADGQVAKTGPVLYAALDVNDERLEMYRFEGDDGEVGYFTPEGESMRRLLMRTPVNGARLSSGFGMRKHPILGYSRMHQGIDFAAPTGTPVYAAGNGTVVRAGRNGGYGNYIEIRHADGYSTAYAHLSRIADDIERGTTVTQGEVIGLIGSTGSSTGPHLHYEVLVNDEPVNPRALDLPTGRTLKGADLDRFHRVMAEIDRQRHDGPDGATRIASACPQEKDGDQDEDDC